MMNVNNEENIIERLTHGNTSFASTYHRDAVRHMNGQHPKAAILTCSDSRVIPEFIFGTSIGDLFIVRVAGNVAIDPSVLFSLDYAVDQLGLNVIIVLGHTHCGAIHAAETLDDATPLLSEIRQSFSSSCDHTRSNIYRQVQWIPRRSACISKAFEYGTLKIVGALYDLETGRVAFLSPPTQNHLDGKIGEIQK